MEETPVEMPVNFLTDEDMHEILNYGSPVGLRPDLAVDSDGTITLTLKGLQYYQHALTVHGLQVSLSSVSSSTDLAALDA